MLELKKIFQGVEIIVLILIFIISAFLTYTILSRLDLIGEVKIIEKEKYTDLKVYIGEKELKEKIKELNINLKSDIDKQKRLYLLKENNIKNKQKNNIDLSQYYKMSFNGKDFLLSNDKDSYNFGFIAKNYVNGILYLYSHNSYKQTENSGYYLYNNLKLNDKLKFNDKINYKIIKTELIDIDKNEENNISVPKDVNIIYFTCTPYGDNIRKVYFLKKQ